VATAGPGTASPLASIEIRHLGGAVGRPGADHGALGAIDAPYLLFAVGPAMTPEMMAAVVERVEAVQTALSQWDGGRLLTFTERPGETARMFADDAYRRLRDVKAAYDRRNLIQANHEIPPAG
jgi:hypothetical protein